MANLATINNNLLADSGIDPLDLIVGTGTVNYIPKFSAEGTIANSAITDNGTTVTLISRDLSGTSALFNSVIQTTGGDIRSIGTASNTVAVGPFVTIYDGATQKQMLHQLNASFGEDIWNYNGTAWTKVYTLSAAGAGEYLNSISAHDGEIIIQSAATNNSWVGNNFYYDGAFKYKRAGYAQALYFDAADFEIRVANTGAANGAITWTVGLRIYSATGNVETGQDFTANKLIKSGGTASQYLMADGSTSTLTNPVTGTGTTNYLPKWTSASAIGNSNIVLSSGANFVEMTIGSTSGATNNYNTLNILAVTEPRIYLTASDGFNSVLYNSYGSIALQAQFSSPSVNNNIFYYDGSSATNRSLTFQTEGSNRLTINQAGTIRFNAYGGGTITGTRAYDLAVDASGNIIEVAVGAGTVTGTGTTNYLPKWTSASAIGDSQIVDNGTNVGIGTNTPRARLYVYGGDIAAYKNTGINPGAQLYLGDLNFENAGYWDSAPGLGAVYSTNGTSVAGDLAFYIYGSLSNSRSEVMRMVRVGSDNRVAIGTSTAYANLQVLGTIKVATGNAQGILGLGEGNGTTVNVGIWRGAANAPTTDGNYLNLGGYDGIVFATGADVIGSQSQRMRLTADGTLLINQTSTLGNPVGAIEVTGLGNSDPTTQTAVSLFANHGNNANWVGYFSFFKSRGTTQGSVTAVADGDYLGMVRWNGADGTSQVRAAEIFAVVDGAVGTGDMPTRLVFATTPDGTSNPTEKMRITNGGSILILKNKNIGINTADGSDDGYLEIAGASSGGSARAAHIYLSGNERTVDGGNLVLAAGDNTAGTGLPGAILFRTGASNNRAMITNDGQFNINNTTNTTYRFYVAGTSYFTDAMAVNSTFASGKATINSVYVGGTGSGAWSSYLDSVVGQNNLHIGVTSASGALYINYAVAAPTYMQAQGGNVGIGLAAADNLLHIERSIAGTGLGDGILFKMKNASTTADTRSAISFGNISGVGSALAMQSAILKNGTTGEYDMTWDLYGGAAGWQENLLYLDSNPGRVGVGIQAPKSKLHVNGSIQVGFVDVLNDAMILSWAGASAYGAIQTYSSSNLALNPLGNKVLIGQTTSFGIAPTLQISGGIQLSASMGANASAPAIDWWNTNSTGSNIARVAVNTGANIYEGIIRFLTKDSGGTLDERVRITSGGNVVVNSTVANYKFQVNSGISVSTAIAMSLQQATNGAVKDAAAFGLAIQNGGESTNAADLIFYTASGGSLGDRMRVTSGGNLGINTGAPSSRVHAVSSTAISSEVILRLDGGAAGFNGPNDANTGFSIMFDGCSYTGSTGVVQRNGAEIQMLKSGSWNEAAGGSGTKASLVFKTNNGTITSPDLGERMRISPSGNILINQNSALTGVSTSVEMSGVGSSTSTLQASYNVYANHGAANTTWRGYYVFHRSRGTTAGSVTSVADGDYLGTLRWNGADGTGEIIAAEINAIVDGTVGTNDMPARLVFSTTADGASSPTERMIIRNNGVITVNTTSTVVNNRMWVNLGQTESFRAGTWETYSYTVNNAWLGENVYFDGGFKRRAAGYAIALYSDASAGFQIRMAGTSSAGSTISWTNALAINSSYAATFSSSVTATGFFESSDRRIKDLVDQNYKVDGIEIVKPKLYKKNGVLEYGYYAQDFQEILPSAVYVGDNGFLNLSYTQIHSAKIAYLEDSIEEIKAKIIYLENQLKNK